MKKLARIIPLFIPALAAVLAAQQPQTQTAPIYPVNAKYANGVAPGYAPTAGSGLTLNLSAGTVNCGGTIATYPGGTLTMTASTTNYVYLDTSSSCAPAVKTTAFTSSDIPIASIGTTSSITAINDYRTIFSKPGAAGTVVTQINGATGSFTLTGSAFSGCSTSGGVTTCTFTSGSGGGSSIWYFQAGSNSATCNDTTDDTSAFNALLGTVYTAGGGTISVNGTCLISGQITIPNNAGGPPPNHPPIRITGNLGSTQFAASAGGYTAAASSPSVLDMRYNATSGKIVDFGLGLLEIDHIALKDGGTDCATFVYTTNPVVHFHDNLVSGTHSTTSACNVALSMGGTGASVTGDATGTFYGYGSFIQKNEFDKIRTVLLGRSNFNAVVFRDNTIDVSCGSDNTHGAVYLDGSIGSASANIFSGNLWEVQNYPYTIWLNGTNAINNQWFGDTFWDASATTLKVFHATSGAAWNSGVVSTDANLLSTGATKLSDGPVIANQEWFTNLLANTGNQLLPCAYSSGSGTAQVCTTSAWQVPTFTPTNGTIIYLTTSTPNTGSSFTINPNGMGATTVAKIVGGARTTTLTAGDIISGYNPMYYDGTYFVLITPGNGSSTSSFNPEQATATVSGSGNTAVTFSPTPLQYSLQIFKNGSITKPGTDWTLSGATATFGSALSNGDALVGQWGAAASASPSMTVSGYSIANKGFENGTSTSVTSATLSTFSNPLTANSTILVFELQAGTGTFSVPTDTAGNTYADCGGGKIQFDTTNSMQCFYTLNTHTTASNVITIHANTSNPYLYGQALEITGAAASSPIDVYSVKASATGGASGSNNLSATALTPTMNGEMIVAAFFGNSGPVTVGTSPNAFTLGNSSGAFVEYFIQGTAAAITATASDGTSSDPYGALVVGLKP